MRVEQSLPMNGVSMEPNPASCALSHVEQRPRILVVDDVFDNRDILTRRLSRRGYDVVEASGGREALEKIAADVFDVVLLDIMMPDINGNEVLRRIRETKSATELPIIMVTAKSQSEDVVESLELGANDYITKPVDFAVALARISQQVTGKRAADVERASRHAAEKKAADLRSIVDGWSETLRRTSEGLAKDDREQRHSEDRLRYLAYHDSLTGLINRVAFRDLLNEALRNPDQLATQPTLLFIDLDRFKAVNDVHGHEVGDKLLQEVGARLRKVAGSNASLARLGGDEFAVLIFEGISGPALDQAWRMIQAISNVFDINGQQLRIGASCGIAKAADCGNDVDAISKAADLAMYRAKGAGRSGCTVYEPYMLGEQHRRDELEAELRRAISENTLDVAYQPLVSTKTGQITAFEALVRWPHLSHGMIPPCTFIPLAEEAGLIVALGAWVLRRACEVAASWPSHVRIAVNVSALQFRSPDFVSTITECLASSGLDAKRLELEITESTLLEAHGPDVDVFRTIQELGVRFSMDDFGTGYSSMSYLQSFKFDKIKLDRQFVRRAQSGPNNGGFVRAVVNLASSAGMETTAEGIETVEELAAATSYGCTEVQGYLFSLPLNINDACKIISDNLMRSPSLVASAA